jgi:hypothetical protein
VRKTHIEQIAALYDCEIKIRCTDVEEGDVLYAVGNDLIEEAETTPFFKEERICRAYYAAHVDLNAVHEICQRVSGKSLTQFWTSEAK